MIRNSATASAISGLASDARTSARSAPRNESTQPITNMESGISAIEVTRIRQKLPVPSLAAPRPRTLPRGVLMSPMTASSDQEIKEPDRDGQQDGTGERRPAE